MTNQSIKILFLLFTLGLIFQDLWANEKPNIIVIVADDLGNADVGYHNQGTEIPTPNIDKLAAAGVSFTSGYVMAPVCGPSRAALLTGRYQQSFGFVDNSGPFRKSPDVIPGIPTSVKILPEYLKDYGYVTGMFGKWHVGGESKHDPFFPTRRGFDELYGFMGGASGYFIEDNVNLTLFEQEHPVEYESQYLTDALAREAVDFIEREKNNPFFIYLPFNAVHGPLQAPDSLINKFLFVADENRRKLCAMQYSMDKAIGQVLDKLDALNLSENTLVFFISDNGGKINENHSYNTPYNGEKGSLYEGGIRLPFCIKWPGKINAASVYDKPVCSMDILPTVLHILGEDLAAHPELAGKNILPYINEADESSPHETLYWWINNQWAVREGDWKLVYNNGFSRPKLFNLENDLAEQNDLYATNTEKVESLTNLWNEWRADQMDIQWGWNPDIGDYVEHFSENFENIVKQYFNPMGNGIETSIVENPKKEGINTSSTVLKITRPNTDAQNWAGTYASVTQFQRKFRYLHIKMLKSRYTPIRAKLQGKNGSLVVYSNNQQSKVNAWEDFVFDFNEFSGPVNVVNIQPDYEVGALHEIYIDDVHFSDNPTPEIITGNPSYPRRKSIEIYPNPAQDYLSVQSNHFSEYHFSVIDYAGKTVLEEKHTFSKEIDISMLSPGIYFLKINSNDKQETLKFIKL